MGSNNIHMTLHIQRIHISQAETVNIWILLRPIFLILFQAVVLHDYLRIVGSILVLVSLRRFHYPLWRQLACLLVQTVIGGALAHFLGHLAPDIVICVRSIASIYRRINRSFSHLADVRRIRFSLSYGNVHQGNWQASGLLGHVLIQFRLDQPSLVELFSVFFSQISLEHSSGQLRRFLLE